MRRLKQMRFMKKVVLLGLFMCAIYLPVYILCAHHGILLPATLTKVWFALWGTQLCATTVLKGLESKVESKKQIQESEEKV